MALDGMFLHVIKNELEAQLIGARVDKIHQPAKDELIMSLRTRTGTYRMLLSANPANARVQFTTQAIENPKEPPMFCMLLRKHIGNGKLIAIRQQGLDRILYFDFEAVNELGDYVVITLIAEVMGRHSNLIAVNQDGKIIDVIRRVNEDVSSIRPLLPGMTYLSPPSQNKKNILEYTEQESVESFLQTKNEDATKALMQTFEGVSPILAREIVFGMTGGLPLTKDQLIAVHEQRLSTILTELKKRLTFDPQGDHFPLYMALEQNDKPKDFTILPIKQYGGYMKIKEYVDTGTLLDAFYGERDRIERMRQRSTDLLKLIINRIERVTKKIAVWQEDLRVCANRDENRMKGDLLNANLYQMEKGLKEVVVQNFYAEDGSDMTIALDPLLTPVQNAQKYYSEYRKAATAEQKITVLLEEAERDAIYLDSVWDLITRTTSEPEIQEIRTELAEQGFAKSNRSGKSKPDKLQPPLKYRSTDGFLILCGKNNRQNDKLTLKDSRNDDMWLHVQKMAGSHVVIVSEGKPIPDTTMEQAAVIAAYNSKGRESAQVPVDYTWIKNVKKQKGGKPGMVTFVDNKTAYVTPDEALVRSLLQK